MPQHEAITLQTDEKMILTDQLIIEDRNEERGAKDESADSLTVIACLNQKASAADAEAKEAQQ